MLMSNGSARAFVRVIPEPVDERANQAVRLFCMTFPCRHAQTRCRIEEFVGCR
jgi:hypothetical protein